MKNENLKIPIITSGIFLLTSPIIQWVFGLGIGFISYFISEWTETESNVIAIELMTAMALLGILWFSLAKSTGQKWISSFLVLFSICNAFLFFSLDNLEEYFFPDRYIIGTLASGTLLISIGLIKKKANIS